MPTQPTPDNPEQNRMHHAIAWFSIWADAQLRQDRAKSMNAVQELERLGVIVRRLLTRT